MVVFIGGRKQMPPEREGVGTVVCLVKTGLVKHSNMASIHPFYSPNTLYQ